MDIVTTFVLPISGVIIIGAAYWFVTWLKRSRKHKVVVSTIDGAEVDIDTNPSIYARIYDRTTSPSTIYNITLPGNIVTQIKKDNDNHLGRRWLREGKNVYTFNRIAEDTYKILIPPYSMSNPPTRLHSALNQPEAAIFYDVSTKQNVMQKYGAMLLYVGIVIFIMWMAVAD